MNFPLMPDKLYKLLVYMGTGLLIYYAIIQKNNYEKYETQRLTFNIEVESLQFQSKELKNELKEINEEIDDLTRKYSISNPVHFSDSGYVFSKVIKGDKNQVKLSDSISNILRRYDIKIKELRNRNNEIEIKKYALESLYESIENTSKENLAFLILGFFFFLFGLALWFKTEDFEFKLLLRQNLDKPTFSDRCQSCGRLFNSIVKYGSENDKTKNFHFCIDCYSNGEFTKPEITFDEIKEVRNKEMILKGKTKKVIKSELKIMHKLERWN